MPCIAYAINHIECKIVSGIIKSDNIFRSQRFSIKLFYGECNLLHQQIGNAVGLGMRLFEH